MAGVEKVYNLADGVAHPALALVLRYSKREGLVQRASHGEVKHPAHLTPDLVEGHKEVVAFYLLC